MTGTRGRWDRSAVVVVASLFPNTWATAGQIPVAPTPQADERETFATPPATIIHKDFDGNALPPGAVARLGGGRFRMGTSGGGVALSPDGKTLVVAGRSDVARVWDIRTGRLFVQCEITGSGLTDRVAYSPDGTGLALTGGGMEPRVYRLDPAKTPQPFVVLNPRPKDDFGYEFSADGLHLVVAGTDQLYGPVRLARYDVKTGRRDWEVSTAALTEPLMATSRDGSAVALGSRTDFRFRVYDGKTGDLRTELKSDVWMLANLCVSPDGALVAAAVDQEPDRNKITTMLAPPPGGYPPPKPAVVELWDVAAKKIRHSIPHAVPPYSGGLVFSPDGKRLVLAEAEHLTLVDVLSGKDVWRVPVKQAEEPAFSADGSTIALGRNGFVTLHDAKTGALLPESDRPAGTITSVAYLGANRLLLGGDEFQVWDPAEKRPVEIFPAIPTAARPADEPGDDRISPAVVASADGTRAATADQTGRVTVFDLRTARPIRSVPAEPGRFILSPDGKTLYTGAVKGITVWDVETGTKRWVAVVNSEDPRVGWGRQDAREKLLLAVSPDGHTVAYVGRYGSAEDVGRRAAGPAVRVWDAATGRERLADRQPVDTWVSAIALSDDGKLAIGTGTQHCTSSIRIWDVAAKKVTATMEYPDTYHHPTTLAFSTDGRTLAHGIERTGNYLAMRVWEMATGKVRVRFTNSGRQHHYAASFGPGGRTLAVACSDGPVLLWDVWGVRTEKFAKPDATAAARAWNRLGDADPVAAYAAMKLLAAHPAVTVPLARGHLTPVAALDGKRVAALIDELDSPVFATRDSASRELAAAADLVRGALIVARAATASAEQRQRLDRLLKPIDPTAPNQLRLVRAVEVLEQAGTADARRLLTELACGAAGARLTREAAAATARLASAR
jgi:WD40 repeat protein